MLFLFCYYLFVVCVLLMKMVVMMSDVLVGRRVRI